jgi:hypothetical protein
VTLCTGKRNSSKIHSCVSWADIRELDCSNVQTTVLRRWVIFHCFTVLLSLANSFRRRRYVPLCKHCLRFVRKVLKPIFLHRSSQSTEESNPGPLHLQPETLATRPQRRSTTTTTTTTRNVKLSIDKAALHQIPSKKGVCANISTSTATSKLQFPPIGTEKRCAVSTLFKG